MKNRLFAFLMVLVLMMSILPAALAEDTTAEGSATVQGYGGEIEVSVKLDGDKIVDVDIKGDGETAGIGSKVVEEWPEEFENNNGIVDTYSGATFAGVTRAAVIEATRQALTAAGVNPDDYVREAGEKKEENVTLDADVVIVGAGGAGMVAAVFFSYFFFG